MERKIIDPEGLAEAMEREMQYLAATKIDPNSTIVRLRLESRHVHEGYNVEFQGARPPRAGEDY